jgi:hypothetical protein|tara:strand:+ start:467 stop:640 length:174 start_codon:yes stop_codon:yes gene_type:complete
MEEDDILDQDLSTMIIIIGSYLYAGGSIEEVDHIVLDRISELIDQRLDGLTEDSVIH